MKKIIIPISTLFVTGLSYAQTLPSNSENYVYSKTYLSDPTTSSPKIAETIQYFDGLGRPKQVIDVKASPTGKDIVNHIEYDQFGRPAKDFLPIPQSGTQNGKIYPNPLGNGSSVYGAEKIYSEKIIENSPLSRIQQQIQAGNDWTGKPVTLEYSANAEGEVKKYTTATTWVNNASQSSLSLSGSFPAYQLYKNTVKDEDGNETIEFKNDEGLTFLTRKAVSATEYADTYYVYNEFDQLAFIIPPSASALGTLDQNALDNLCYQYRYDGRNHLVEKKIPGKGWEYFVYDKQGRLILSQDANLRTTANNFSQKGWLFNKYDQFGRVVYTGFFANTATRTAMQTVIQNMTVNAGNNETKSTTPFTLSGIDVYYTKNAFPMESMTILSVNYYDTYPVGTPTAPTQIIGQEVMKQAGQNTSSKSTRGLPTASYVKNIEDDSWTKNYSWYDTKARVIGTHSVNHLGGYTKTETELDFAGVPQKTNTYHLRKQDEIGVTVKERFVYDNQNRLKQHYHQVDEKPEELLTENTYNELSQMINKKVGNNLQSIDYAYNIRGWMTDINKNQMSLSDLGGKLFSYKIKYTQKEGITNPDTVLFSGKDVKPRYNGNIAEVDWRAVETLGVNPSSTPKRYGYAYDKLNRLTAGYYQNPNNPYSKENTESLTYDLNGNVTNLYRTSVLESGTNTATLIDRLNYTYNGNQVTNINDVSQNPTGYEGGGGAISYDLNGSMTAIPDKGISSIKYNYLNLPNNLSLNKNGNENLIINTKYRADGTKLTKENVTTITGFNGSVTTKKTTDYLDGFQYLKAENISGGGSTEMLLASSLSQRAMQPQAFSLTGPVVTDPTIDPPIGGGGVIVDVKTPDLQFFPTAEGFYDYTKNQYIYSYADQVGNVRVSFAKNSAGALEIVDANDYYPFGMNHLKTGTAFFGQSSFKNYKFANKELQEFGFYDFGNRLYMDDIVRWGVVDNKAEKYLSYSPYHYAGNNPISNFDIDGNEFTPEAWEWVNKLVADINKKQEKNNAEIAEYQAKINGGGKAGQIKRWERSIASLQETNTELETARGETAVLANSNQVYHIRADDSQSEKGVSISYTMFGFSSGRVIIGLSSNGGLELLSHELRHAYQFETGESGFVNEGLYIKKTQFLHDKTDEVDGYRRGSFFGGSTYGVNDLPENYKDLPTGPVSIKTDPQITRALSLPESQRDQALQRIANEGKAFRANGKTYYKK
ncbi:DUF6443 domain-containing protein [Chryseobacterium lathyri]|uniref:RHS repeat-associated protein n=1 Tax=Chryseobacterium lathyri TaxID=395933 RepID=A0ABT9SS16_9FLAO|nr:DUF6443 domain-containing protein [Chryseobacterium lathyri]MDP9962234.1 RHS repeat-associated protein [Chryseobacterium lathyri]